MTPAPEQNKSEPSPSAGRDPALSDLSAGQLARRYALCRRLGIDDPQTQQDLIVRLKTAPGMQAALELAADKFEHLGPQLVKLALKAPLPEDFVRLVRFISRASLTQYGLESDTEQLSRRLFCEAASFHWQRTDHQKIETFLGWVAAGVSALTLGDTDYRSLFKPWQIPHLNLILKHSLRSNHDLKVFFTPPLRHHFVASDFLANYYGSHGFLPPAGTVTLPVSGPVFQIAMSGAHRGNSFSLTQVESLVNLAKTGDQDVTEHLAQILRFGGLQEDGLKLIETLYARTAALAADQKVLLIDALTPLASVGGRVGIVGVRLLVDLLGDNQLERIRPHLDDLRQGNIYTVEGALFADRIRANARVTRERSVAELREELLVRMAPAPGSSTEQAIIAVATTLTAIITRSTAEPGRSKDYLGKMCASGFSAARAQNFEINFFSWLRCWSIEQYGFAPNTAQLFAVLLGIRTLQTKQDPNIRGAWIELATGEGKSYLLAMMAAYQALHGKTVHILTPNSYLAGRDTRFFEPLFSALGISCTCYVEKNVVAEGSAPSAITYSTANDMCFGSLRAQLAGEPFLNGAPRDLVPVDELDALFIDSGLQRRWISTTDRSLYAPEFWKVMDRLLPKLTSDLGKSVAYLVDADPKTFEDEDPFLLAVYVAASADVKRLRCDEHFIIDEEGHVVILDTKETHRQRPSTVWIHGIHQLVALRENTLVPPRGRVLGATSTYAFIQGYREIFGCSGTMGDETELQEVLDIYGLSGFKMPVNNRSVRIDHPIELFPTDLQLENRLFEEIQRQHDANRPLLIAAASLAQAREWQAKTEQSQLLDDVKNLDPNGLPDSEEAIILRAGRAGMITHATPMVGRGTDIRPDPAALAAGGLHVIVTGVPNLQRGEDQLRRRAARQGEPGSSIVFASFESDPFLRDLPTEVREALREFVHHPAFDPRGTAATAMVNFIRAAQTFCRSGWRRRAVHSQRAIESGIDKYIAKYHSVSSSTAHLLHQELGLHYERVGELLSNPALLGELKRPLPRPSRQTAVAIESANARLRELFLERFGCSIETMGTEHYGQVADSAQKIFEYYSGQIEYQITTWASFTTANVFKLMCEVRALIEQEVKKNRAIAQAFEGFSG